MKFMTFPRVKDWIQYQTLRTVYIIKFKNKLDTLNPLAMINNSELISIHSTL